MQEDKHRVALQEVMAAIQDGLSGGLLNHQRRIMAMLSLGTQQSIELYLHRKAVLKSGAQIKHEWFKLSDKNIQERMQPSLTKKWELIDSMNEVISFARTIETDRNDIVYGAPLESDKKLRELINTFLTLTAIIEKETGKLT